MIGDPYATPLPRSLDYPTKPKPSGMPTQYQDTPPKHWDGIGASGGGDKFALPGDAPAGTPGGAMPGMQDQPQPYGGMADLDRLLQQRRANDDQRRLLAQMLAGQQQPQGPAPYANSPHPLDLPPPAAQASPWSIVAAAFNGLAEGVKRAKSQGATNEGATSWWGSDGGMKS